MATYGEIRLRLKQAFPAINQELLDGWLMDRYQQIIDLLPWKRLDAQADMQTAASYAAGAVDVAAGSDVVTGSGTAWTSVMSGRVFRVAGREEYYEFEYVSETEGRLSRPYEGETAAAAAYTIVQSVYVLPENFVMLRGARRLDGAGLAELSVADLNRRDPARAEVGEPRHYALFMDESSDPPRMQIELWPAPDRVIGLALWGEASPDLGDAYDTAVRVLPWVRPAAIVAGASADARRHLKDNAGEDRDERRFQALVAVMVAQDCRRRGGTPMKLAPWIWRHQARRWAR